jgi:hypothetical protein
LPKQALHSNISRGNAQLRCVVIQGELHACLK